MKPLVNTYIDVKLKENVLHGQILDYVYSDIENEWKFLVAFYSEKDTRLKTIYLNNIVRMC